MDRRTRRTRRTAALAAGTLAAGVLALGVAGPAGAAQPQGQQYDPAWYGQQYDPAWYGQQHDPAWYGGAYGSADLLDGLLGACSADRRRPTWPTQRTVGARSTGIRGAD